MTGNMSQKFEYPSLGSFKWKPDLKGLRLYDGNGQLLARWQTTSGQNQTLDFFVSGQGEFVDMVVVTALAGMNFQQKEIEQVQEAMDAVDVVSDFTG
jgi:ABC-type Fe3+ transport system substrate-binding protein